MRCSGVVVKGLIAIALLATTRPAFSEPELAREILAYFCGRDTQGDQLQPQARRELAWLFTMPDLSRGSGEVTVVKDYVVSRPAWENGRAEFYVEYIELGRIERLTARFRSRPSIKVRDGFHVSRTAPAGTGGALKRFGEWRIDGAMPAPHLSVAAAIRYADELRKNATDSLTRRDAERTLAVLRHLR